MESVQSVADVLDELVPGTDEQIQFAGRWVKGIGVTVQNIIRSITNILVSVDLPYPRAWCAWIPSLQKDISSLVLLVERWQSTDREIFLECLSSDVIEKVDIGLPALYIACQHLLADVNLDRESVEDFEDAIDSFTAAAEINKTELKDLTKLLGLAAASRARQTKPRRSRSRGGRRAIFSPSVDTGLVNRVNRLRNSKGLTVQEATNKIGKTEQQFKEAQKRIRARRQRKRRK